MDLKNIEFSYMFDDCPSDGCPEYYFNYRREFKDEYGEQAYRRAIKTVERYLVSNYYMSYHTARSSKTILLDDEVDSFVDSLRDFHPNISTGISLYTCKHGLILFHKGVRFEKFDIKRKKELEEKINSVLPFDLDKEGQSLEIYPVSTYFIIKDIL